MNPESHRSHAEAVTLPCRVCAAAIDCEIWIIVDTDERPDLLARAQAGTLHEMICPRCGEAAVVNAPLLLVRPGAEPVLLFSPARGGTPATDEEQAVALTGMLRQNLGDDWRDDWLARGLTGVPRESLPVLLAGDPATAAGLAAAHAADDDGLTPDLRQALGEVILALAAEGVRIQSADDLRRELETRPEMRARLAALLRRD